MKRIGSVAYEIELPNDLAKVHPVFHVSMLRKFIGDIDSIVVIPRTSKSEPELKSQYFKNSLVTCQEAKQNPRRAVLLKTVRARVRGASPGGLFPVVPITGGHPETYSAPRTVLVSVEMSLEVPKRLASKCQCNGRHNGPL